MSRVAYPGAMRRFVVMMLAVALAACGSTESKDPVGDVPAASGQREAVRAALTSSAAEVPAVRGRTLQEVADSLDGSGPEAALASSVFTVGRNRLAFGEIDGKSNAFVYGRTAV